MQELAEPVEHLICRIKRIPVNARYFVALAGVPGAGKSTLATRITALVNASFLCESMVALGMDGFHLSRAALAGFPDAAEALARRGAPWTFDASGMAQRLRQLRRAAGYHGIGWPTFEHSIGDPVENGMVVPATVKLVLVEGLYLLHQMDGWEEVGRQFDERWYLDTPLELAMERLAHRHREAWGISQAQAEARIAGNDGLNAEIVQRSRRNADYSVKSLA